MKDEEEEEVKKKKKKKTYKVQHSLIHGVFQQHNPCEQRRISVLAPVIEISPNKQQF